MKMNNFSKWSKWQDRAILKGLEFPGVYAMAISQRDLSKKPFSLIENIVYFGMTNSVNGLKGRLGQFDTTIKSGTRRLHGGAERFLPEYPKYEKLTAKLYVSINPVDCDVRQKNNPNELCKMGEILRFEYICFAEYVKKFKRRPEFNDEQRSPKK